MVRYPTSITHRHFVTFFAVLACGIEFSRAVADGAADSPEAVVSAYMEIPTAEWQKRLAFVAEPEKARPLMEKWYASNVVSTGNKVIAVAGATDPSLYRKVSDTFKVSFTIENPDGSKGNGDFFVVRTSRGFKIDWLQSLKPDLLAKGWWEQGRIAVDAKLPEIAVKHLESVGERFENKPVRMLSLTFDETSDLWLTNLPGVMVDSNGLVTRYNKKAAEGWIGFSAADRHGKRTSKFFARKDKWEDKLLELDRGTLVNVVGVVTPMEGMTDYGILIYDIEILE